MTTVRDSWMRMTVCLTAVLGKVFRAGISPGRSTFCLIDCLPYKNVRSNDRQGRN